MTQMLRERHLIDLFKGLTFLIVLALMALYDAWGQPAAWLYLGLHGSYGLLWVWKGQLFPDVKWQRALKPGQAIFLSLGLTVYWSGAWLTIARQVELPLPIFGLAPAMYALGVFLHFASDLQKATALKLRPNQLIQSGLFGKVRNINYFGELLIYLSFALIPRHWFPFLVLAAAVLFVWLPNMRAKDRSLARYPEFEAYQRRSWLFIPFLY